ncbi:MAG: hypothetical protein V7677_10360 [Motiliproteus sp.]
MTKEIKLQDFVSERGKRLELARALCITTGALTQMVQSGRDIRVLQHSNGSLEAYEVKPLGKTKTAKGKPP